MAGYWVPRMAAMSAAGWVATTAAHLVDSKAAQMADMSVPLRAALTALLMAG